MDLFDLAFRALLESLCFIVNKFGFGNLEIISQERFKKAHENFVNFGSEVAEFRIKETSNNDTPSSSCCDFSHVATGSFTVQDFSQEFKLGIYKLKGFKASFNEDVEIKKNPTVCRKCFYNEMLMQQISSILSSSSFPTFELFLNMNQRRVALPVGGNKISGIRIGENKYYLVGIFGNSVMLISLKENTGMFMPTTYVLEELHSQIVDLENVDGPPSIFTAPANLFLINRHDSTNETLFLRSGNNSSVTSRNVNSNTELEHKMIIRPTPLSVPRKFELHFIHEFKSPYTSYKFLTADQFDENDRTTPNQPVKID